ncbi:hypothetical protein QZH41_015118 [Actinostola sp. cb2023]|nr:hypothetical protein QZH41_015118 [Actinostola sp. cb2023]
MDDRKSRTVLFKTAKKFTLIEIKEAVNTVLGEDRIEVIQELSAGTEYLLQMKSKTDRENMMDAGLDIEECHVSCHPPHGLYTNVSIMGLKAFIDDEKVCEALRPHGEIKSDVFRLRYKNGHALAGIENGNRLVKMILTKTIPYALKIDGGHCRIIHSDQKPTCTYCAEEGHARQKCPTIVCHFCRQPGHMWRNCKNGFGNIQNTRTPLEAVDNSETETPQENNTSDESPDNEQPEHIMESEDDSEQPDKVPQQDIINNEPKRAPPFTLAELVRMTEYCLKTVQGLRGLWLWTITVFSFGLFLRGEEPLCLKTRHITLPQNYAADSGKLPQRVDIKIPWSKADRKAKGVTLTLWANPLNHDLCPVTALLVWLLVTGVRKGFIFPRVAKNNYKILPGSARGVTSYRKVFSEVSIILFGSVHVVLI